MSFTREATTVEDWLQWFATEKQAACQAHLCARYYLNALDAEALINAAQMEVFLHWATLENPLAYFWRTLKHAVAKQGQRRSRERQQLAAFAQQHRRHAHSAARTAQHDADVLTLVSPRQRHILAWYAQGYEDQQVAAWLQTTPEAVRVARHTTYRSLRAQLYPSARLRKDAGVPSPSPQENKNFLDTANILCLSKPHQECSMYLHGGGTCPGNESVFIGRQA
jgi:DNA-binding CsgD family transcriptional regulator